MSQDLFLRIKNLLQNHVELLNEHRLGDSHVEQAESIIDEINILLKSDRAGEIEREIDNAERQVISEDIAEEILNGKYCIGGNCDD
jgi:hypothetical protein